jgi:hypothetical protein
MTVTTFHACMIVTTRKHDLLSPGQAARRRWTRNGDLRNAILRDILPGEIQAAASGEGQTEKLKTLAKRMLLLPA